MRRFLFWICFIIASVKEWLHSFARVNIVDLFNRVPNARMPVISLIVNEVVSCLFFYVDESKGRQ